MASPVIQPVLVRPIRKLLYDSFGTIANSPNDVLAEIYADAVLEENGEDSIVLTTNPVEQGSVITDNGYNEPVLLSLVYAWWPGSQQNFDQDESFLQTIYDKFLTLKKNITSFDVYTGKRVYKSMVIQSISNTTDKDSENILVLRINFQEIIVVTTQTTMLAGVNNADSSVQAFPQKTSPVSAQGQQQLQPAPTFNATANAAPEDTGS